MAKRAVVVTVGRVERALCGGGKSSYALAVVAVDFHAVAVGSGVNRGGGLVVLPAVASGTRNHAQGAFSESGGA